MKLISNLEMSFVNSMRLKEKAAKRLKEYNEGKNEQKIQETKIPEKLLKKIKQEEFMLDDYTIYKFTKKEQNERSKKSLFFIHGGAFVSPPTLLHFKLIFKIVKKTNCTAYFIRYPLSKNPVTTSNHVLKAYMWAQNDWNIYSPNNIDVVFGDSAGGTLALFLLSILPKQLQPKQTIAFSPCVDLSLNNKDAIKVQSIDNVLSLDVLKAIRPLEIKHGDPKDPLINLLYADFSRINKLDIFTSENDVLMPDVALLHEKLLSNNIKHNYYFCKNMCHDWLLFPFFVESAQAKKQIIKTINSL
jgi:acetyl esterase/lipase